MRRACGRGRVDSVVVGWTDLCGHHHTDRAGKLLPPPLFPGVSQKPEDQEVAGGDRQYQSTCQGYRYCYCVLIYRSKLNPASPSGESPRAHAPSRARPPQRASHATMHRGLETVHVAHRGRDLHWKNLTAASRLTMTKCCAASLPPPLIADNDGVVNKFPNALM